MVLPRLCQIFCVLPAILAISLEARGGDAATAGKLVEEVPTIKCLGVRWFVGGDDNGDAAVRVEYRKAGTEKWRRGLDLFRETRGRYPVF